MDLNDEVNRVLQEEERQFKEAEVVTMMSMSDGWKIIEKRLDEEFKGQLDTLLEILAVPENLPKIAVAQAQAKACLYTKDMVKNYAELYERYKEDQLR